MNQLRLIINTELFQLKQDKRLILSLTIFTLIFISSITSILLYSVNEVTQLNHELSKTNNVFSILIFLFSILSFSTASLVASDITAGEKERNTIEALFMTQCPKSYIFWGKYSIILLFSLFPLIISLVMMILLSITTTSILISFSELLRIIFIILPYSFLISMIMIVNGFRAKTIRSAKSTELVFFLAIPLISLIFSQIEKLIEYLIIYTIITIGFVLLARYGLKYIESEKLFF